jgi:hypothetical protein
MTKFPVNFPVSREGAPETGSTMTGSSASLSESNWQMTFLKAC